MKDWPVWHLLKSTAYVCAFAAALVLASATRGDAAEAVLYRLFLMDGTTLISYGEFSRVADRVVFSIPLGATEEAPALELVSIPQTAVDWERTDRYSEAVRARRYAETSGENDFARLSVRVAEALNQIALTIEPRRRLAMAVEARGNLARWPADNFGFRAADVAQLVAMLDEVISELRVAAGQSSFDLTLVANVTPSFPAPLMPEPSFRRQDGTGGRCRGGHDRARRARLAAPGCLDRTSRTGAGGRLGGGAVRASVVRACHRNEDRKIVCRSGVVRDGPGDSASCARRCHWSAFGDRSGVEGRRSSRSAPSAGNRRVAGLSRFTPE